LRPATMTAVVTTPAIKPPTMAAVYFCMNVSLEK
jgi:hypothetical protein